MAWADVDVPAKTFHDAGSAYAINVVVELRDLIEKDSYIGR